MPREFQDFSDEVSQGTGRVREGLNQVREAADSADASSSRLGNTQERGTVVAENYSKTMAGVARNLSGISDTSRKTSKSMAMADMGARDLGASLYAISSGASEAAVGMGEIVRVSDDLHERLSKLSGRSFSSSFNLTGAEEAVGISGEIESAMSRIHGREVRLDFSADSALSASEMMSGIEDQASSIHDRHIAMDIDVSQIDRASDSVSDLSGNIERAGMQARKAADYLDEQAGTMAQLDAPEAPDATSFDRVLDELSEQIKSRQDEIKDMELGLRKLERSRVVSLSIEGLQLREVIEFSEELGETEQQALIAAQANGKLGEAIDDLAARYPRLAKQMEAVTQEGIEQAKATKGYYGEVDKVSGVQGLLNNRFAEGAREADEFAGGLATSNGMLIGAGVAAVYLSGKVKEVIDQFKEAAIELSVFRVELDALEARAAGLGFTGTFDSMRAELNLTRAQSEQFFQVLESGAQSGVVSTNRLVMAAGQLRDVFGGDQTQRLEEYVNLLKDIPSLDTDLNITATMDDRSAAVFQLAREGKVSTIIDLQAAGLLGGVETNVITPENVELINASQKTERTVEDVHDFITGKLFPSWGPVFSEIAGGVANAARLGAGIITAVGAVKLMVGTQVAAQKATTQAILATRGGAQLAGSILRTRGGMGSRVGAGRAVQRASLKVFGPKLTGTVLGFSRNVKSAALSAKSAAMGLTTLARVGAITGTVFTAAGFAADFLADKMDESGNEIGSAATRLSGELSLAAGTILGFAALGSAIPGIGNAAGAAVGVVAAAGLILATQMRSMGESAEMLGEELQETTSVGDKKFTPWMVKAGEILETSGRSIKTGFDATIEAVVEGGSFLAESMEGVGDVIVETVKQIPLPKLRTGEYQKEIDAATRETELLNARIARLSLIGKEYASVIAEDNQRIQNSALALERQFNATKAAVDSGKVAFLDFQTEVSGARLDNITQIGGSLSGFNTAIESSSESVRDRFSAVTQAFQKRRSDILQDSELTAKDRRNALLDLKNQELEATKTFVDGVERTVQALFDAPDIIASRLSRETEQATFEVEVEAGSIGVRDFTNSIKSQFDSATSEAEGTARAYERAEEEIQKTQDALARAQEAYRREVVEVADDLPDGVRKALENAGIEIGDQDVEIDVDAAKKAMDELQAEAQGLESSIDAARKKLPEGAFISYASMIDQSSEEIELLNSALENAEESIREARKKASKADDGEEADEALAAIEEATRKRDDLRKKRANAQKAQKDAQRELIDDLQGTLKGQVKESQIREAITVLSEMIRNGEDIRVRTLLDQKDLNHSLTTVLQAITSSEEDGAKEVRGQIRTNENKLDQNIKVTEILRGLVDADQANLKASEMRLESLRRLVEANNNISRVAEALNQVLETREVRNSQRRLDLIRGQESISRILNQSIENVIAQQMEQVELTQRSVGALDMAISVNKEKRKKLEQQLAEAVPGQDTRQIEKNLQVLRDLESKLVSQRNDAIEALGRTGEEISQALDAFQESLSGRRIAQQFNLSDTMSELAQFSDDFEAIMRESTRAGIRAANERAAEELAILEKTQAIAFMRLRERARLAEMDTPGTGREVMEEGRRLLLAQERTEQARIEKEQKTRVVELAEREKSIKMDSIGLEEELIDAEMDFVTEMGGHFSSILQLQQRGLALEYQKLETLEKELAIAEEQGLRGNELRKKQIAVEKQKFDIQKKAMGVQKDVFEKILDKEFGKMRSEVGAARRRGSDVGMLGRENTRVMGRSGLYLKAGEGDVRPIGERAINRQLGAVFGGSNGGMLDTAPERLEIEKEIAAAGKDTAENTGALARASTDRGSLYTHDIHSEGLLGSLVEVGRSSLNALMDIVSILKGCCLGGEQERTEAGEASTTATGRSPSSPLEKSSSMAVEEQKRSNKTLDRQLDIARKNLQEKKDQFRESDTDSSRDELSKAEREVYRIETEIRKADIMNPYAAPGFGYSHVEDYERIMSGRRMGEKERQDDKKAGRVTEVRIEGDIEDTRRNSVLDDVLPELLRDRLEKNRKMGKDTPYFDALERRLKEESENVVARSESESGSVLEIRKTPYGYMGVKNPLNEDADFNKVKDEVGRSNREDLFERMGRGTDLPTAEEMEGREEIVETSRRPYNASESDSRGAMEDVSGLGSNAGVEVGVAGVGDRNIPEQAGIKVQGEILVRVDNKMFRAEVTKLVAEAISTAEVRTALNKNGYLKSI